MIIDNNRKAIKIIIFTNKYPDNELTPLIYPVFALSDFLNKGLDLNLFKSVPSTPAIGNES